MDENLLVATPSGRHPWSAIATFRDRSFRASIGRAGLTADKHEGDGASPIGTWSMRQLLFRPDRVTPKTALAMQPIRPEDGWCDDPTHRDYNRLVKLPFDARHEELWRKDNLYDLVVLLGYNDDPPVAGKGSAIFLHVLAQDRDPTAGCLAIGRDELLLVLAQIGRSAAVQFRPA